MSQKQQFPQLCQDLTIAPLTSSHRDSVTVTHTYTHTHTHTQSVTCTDSESDDDHQPLQNSKYPIFTFGGSLTNDNNNQTTTRPRLTMSSNGAAARTISETPANTPANTPQGLGLAGPQAAPTPAPAPALAESVSESGNHDDNQIECAITTSRCTSSDSAESTMSSSSWSSSVTRPSSCGGIKRKARLRDRNSCNYSSCNSYASDYDSSCSRGSGSCCSSPFSPISPVSPQHHDDYCGDATIDCMDIMTPAYLRVKRTKMDPELAATTVVTQSQSQSQSLSQSMSIDGIDDKRANYQMSSFGGFAMPAPVTVTAAPAPASLSYHTNDTSANSAVASGSGSDDWSDMCPPPPPRLTRKVTDCAMKPCAMDEDHHIYGSQTMI
jgi:hypothetical protein